MCCFSKPVISVSSTNIFARPADNGRQFLVYSMNIRAKYDLAMILPLPVKTPANEKDVQFIELKSYPDFFSDMEKGFPRPPSKEGVTLLSGTRAGDHVEKLEVIQVGNFEASFVPTVNDFSRLDERFRLPKDTWSKLPAYKTYGFAVFKLKPGAMTVHPMAFSFPRKDPVTLFFPTVHIHDGKVHKDAHFDHALFCQPTPNHRPATEQWQESYTHPVNFMTMEKTKGVVLPNEHCYKHEMHGSLPNRDTLLNIEI